MKPEEIKGSDGRNWPSTTCAKAWAKAFMVHTQKNPAIAKDEDTMLTWFANAMGVQEIQNTEEQRIEEIARVCHQINKAYCESQKDDSQVDWDNAPEWQKMSAINGVRIHMENPDLSPSASHEAWLAEKERDGWKYGAKKSESLRTHPSCVDFEDLPLREQAKDFIFKAIVAALKGGLI